MIRQLPFSLLCSLAWGTIANAMAAPAGAHITAAPKLVYRQNNQNFMGYLSTDGTWSSLDCDSGLTWFQDGNFATCCPSSLVSCPAPTRCAAGTQIYTISGSTTSIACTKNYNNPRYSVCNSVFIFENTGDSKPRTNIVCGESAQNWSLYRSVPAQVSSNAVSAGISVASTTPTPTSAPQEEKSSSKAWIAGAVVGPIVGIAIIAAVVFLLMRRKKKNSTAPVAGAVTAGNHPQGFSDKPAQPYQQQPPINGQYLPAQTAYQQNDMYKHGYEPNQQYPQSPTSPAPQYSAAYQAPGAPPIAEAPANHAQHPPQPQIAELGPGGPSSPGTPGSPPALSGANGHTELPVDGQRK